MVSIAHERVYTESFNLVVGRELALRKRSDLIALLKAVDKAEAFILDKPAEAKAILGKVLNLDDKFVDWMWPQLAFKLSLQQGLIKTLESQARWAIREGHVQARDVPDYLLLVDPRPLGQADPQAVGIVP